MVLSAQEKQVQKPVVAKSSEPVTETSFLSAAYRLCAAADKTVGLKPLATPTAQNPTKPVRRSQVVATLHTLFEHFRPKFRMAPRPWPCDTEAIAKHNAPSDRPVLESLVKWGFVAPVGPIVIGPDDKLTPAEVGDALGIFFCQVAYLTHTPDPKWTPGLQRTDGR